MVSSDGNEKLEQKYVNHTGTDVVAKLFVDYASVRPIINNDTGLPVPNICQVVSIISLDPCGSLIQWIKNKCAAECANNVQRKVAYIKENKLFE